MRQSICLILVVILLLINSSEGFSQQLKLGKNPSAVLKSAVLELQSDNQGLLFPRLTDTAGINLLSPPDGMVIYLTTTKQLFVRANSRWSALTSGTLDTTNIANFYQKVRGLLGATSPLAFNATTGIFSIPQASSTAAGYLSSADWTRFNNLTLGWSRTGDAGTNSATNFIGTTDAQDLVFRTDNIERWRIQNTSGDIKIGDANSGTFKATKELVMREDGDTYGSSILRLRNRNAENGAIFETTTTDPGATLVDFIFKTSVNQRNIRYESRSTYSLVGVPAFHIGGSNPDVPNLAIGDVYSAFNTKLKIGNYTTATEMLDVAGNVKFSGAIMPGGSAGTSGYFLKSNGANTAPTWAAIDTSNITNFYLKVRSLNTVSSPLTYNSTTGLIGITQATTSASGYLSNTDWNTFNNKLSSVDTSNISNFSTKVRNLFSAGTGITYNSSTGMISATGSGSSGDNTTMLSVDRSTSSNSLVNVTGLSFSVTAGKTYKFKFFITYTSSSTSRGSAWSIDGPNNPTLLSYYSNYNTNSTNSITNNQGLTDYDLPSTPNGSSLLSGNIAIIEGIIKPSSSGTVIARFASESSGVITAKAGSYVEYKQLD